ncbi:MAG: Activator of Hsp90 ATPase 1 family protein [Sediminibacterium sp.]|nr:Activator of Hsp90 ATPase 1 family protein [Sediminibacterium sp.]
MQLEVNTQTRIGAPVEKVFEAIIDPEKMSQYFISSSTGPMIAGRTVEWTWADYNVTIPIEVDTVEPDRLIVFRWTGSYTETVVTIELIAETGNITLVKVREKGWDKDDDGIHRLAEQTQGWVEMLLCLKAFVQYGINLRKV